MEDKAGRFQDRHVLIWNCLFGVYSICLESDAPLWPWRSTESGNVQGGLEMNNVAIYITDS